MPPGNIRHAKHDFWFAVVVEDHKVTKPRDADMLRFAIDKLESQFGDALELGAKAEPSKINGLPAQKIRVQGTNQVRPTGSAECHMFFKDGIAYYLFLASPDWAVVEISPIALPRKATSASKVETTRLAASNRSPMRIRSHPTASSQSAFPEAGSGNVTPNAQGRKTRTANSSSIRANIKEKGQSAKTPSCSVLTIPKKRATSKEAMKAGREYLASKLKNDNDHFKIVHAAEVSEGQSELGTLEDIGNRRGRIVDLKKMFNEEAKRYYLMAVINEPDLAYVVICDCAWESRQIWRQDFPF